MFEKLGYKIDFDLNDILIYKKEFALGATQEFIFHKKDDGMYFKNSVVGQGVDFLTYKELQAINKQVEELWDDDLLKNNGNQ